jgi:hypothetical protein
VPDEPGFEVTIYAENAPPVAFTLAPDRLRKHIHPAIAATAQSGDRSDLFRAAVENLSWVFDPRKDPNNPVYVDDASGVTLIRPSYVTMVRIDDATLLSTPPDPRPIGFVRPSEGSK